MKITNPSPDKLPLELPWPCALVVYLRRLMILFLVTGAALVPALLVSAFRGHNHLGVAYWHCLGGILGCCLADMVMLYVANWALAVRARNNLHALRNLRERIRALSANVPACGSRP
jgi:hypothetical protein